MPLRPLSSRTSSVLLAYYFGPDHPFKLRLWGWMRRWMKGARFRVRYAGVAWLALDETDFVQRHVLEHGAYEPEVWQALERSAAAAILPRQANGALPWVVAETKVPRPCCPST